MKPETLLEFSDALIAWDDALSEWLKIPVGCSAAGPLFQQVSAAKQRHDFAREAFLKEVEHQEAYEQQPMVDPPNKEI
jgi:hypothetical protein